MIEFDRNQGIGGSDVPIIVGMSPYRSAIDLWDEKRGQTIARESSIRMRIGSLLEDGIAKLYAEQEQCRIVKPSKAFGLVRGLNALVPNPDVERRFGYPTWAQVDRRRIGTPTVGVEVKHTAQFDRFSGDELPDDVAVQVQHAMMVTGWKQFDVVSLSAGRDLRVHRINADPETHDAIREACLTFWRQVQSGESPPPDGSDAAGRYLRDKYGTEEEGKVVTATHDVLPRVADVLRLATTKKQVERELEEAKQLLMEFMGDAERLEVPGDVRITWKSQRGRRDWKAVATDLRHLIELAKFGSVDWPNDVGKVTSFTTDEWLDFIESMHTGEPSRVFRLTGKAVAL